MAALVVSFLVHFSGLGLMARSLLQDTGERVETDGIALGNAFENLADVAPEPVPAEPAPVPEPPEEPTQATPPTSRALVASNDPQNVDSPGLGLAAVPQPDTIPPAKPASELDSADSSETAFAPSSVTETPVNSQEQPPSSTMQPVEANTTAAVPSSDVTPTSESAAPEQAAVSAASPETRLTTAVDSGPVTIPVEPAETEPADASLPELIVAPVSESPELAALDGETGGTELAVRKSPRPRPAVARSSAATDGGSQAPPAFDLAPQTAEQRRKADQASIGFGGEITNGIALLQSRRPGNSNTTNFAGRVLVHLNRTPPVDSPITGATQVVFEINSDGSIAWVNVTVSSGSIELDSLAVSQVRRASPFPRPPAGERRTFSFFYRSR